MATQIPGHDGRADRIHECFRQWDTEGKGYITRQDLHVVLSNLMPAGERLSAADIDRLMEEADRNRNGRIEYTEFCQWLTRPGASMHASSEEVNFFDLEELLRPLFKIYDRNGDGVISHEEFVECHSIMQTAMTLHPVDETAAYNDPDVLVTNPSKVFKKVDLNGDRSISFDEFVRWQRHALGKSGLLNEDLLSLLPALTRQLQRVFKLSKLNEKGELLDHDQNVLQHIIQNVANVTRDLYNTHEAGRKSLRGPVHFKNRWSEPPVGLNIDRLKGVHLSNIAVPTWGTSDVDLVVLVVPEVEECDGMGRRWLARVTRDATHRAGGKESDEPVYYFYVNLRWMRAAGLAEAFQAAYDQLPPELRIFCYLKAEANFGVQMSWQQVQAALRRCVEGELITDEQFQLYSTHLEAMVASELQKQDLAASSGEAKRLQAKTMLAPRHVMAGLAELGIIRVSSVWVDVLER